MDQITNLKQNIEREQNKVREYQNKIKQLIRDIKNTKYIINGLVKLYDVKHRKIADLKSKIITLNSEIAVLHEKINKLKKQISILKREINILNNINSDYVDDIVHGTTRLGYSNSKHVNIKKDALQTNKTTYNMIISENNTLNAKENDIMNKLTKGDQETILLQPYHELINNVQTVLYYVYYILFLLYAYFILVPWDKNNVGKKIFFLILLVLFPFFIHSIEKHVSTLFSYIWSIITMTPYDR